MRKQCNCEKPYIQKNDIDTCLYCGDQCGWLMILYSENPISVEREYNGDEFYPGDLVLCNRKTYACIVEIISFDRKNKMWYVELPNRGMHYTKILGFKIN